ILSSSLAAPTTFSLYSPADLRALHSFPTRRSSDLSPGLTLATPGPTSSTIPAASWPRAMGRGSGQSPFMMCQSLWQIMNGDWPRSEEHTSELQSRFDLVCRLLLEKKKKTRKKPHKS